MRAEATFETIQTLVTTPSSLFVHFGYFIRMEYEYHIQHSSFIIKLDLCYTFRIYWWFLVPFVTSSAAPLHPLPPPATKWKRFIFLVCIWPFAYMQHTPKIMHSCQWKCICHFSMLECLLCVSQLFELLIATAIHSMRWCTQCTL